MSFFRTPHGLAAIVGNTRVDESVAKSMSYLTTSQVNRTSITGTMGIGAKTLGLVPKIGPTICNIIRKVTPELCNPEPLRIVPARLSRQ